MKPTPSYVEIYGNVQSLEVGTDDLAVNEPGAVTFRPAAAAGGEQETHIHIRMHVL